MNNNKHTMTKPYLPSVHQTWAHSVCDRHTLANILSEQKVTAIETDILMGSFVDHDEIPVANVNFEERIPIMAHPPSRSSNLTPDIFFDMVFRCQDKAPHIKLDFKEIDTVQSVLGSLMDSYSKHCMDDLNLDEKLCVYLNADVLAGPGMQNESAKVDAEDFMNICSDIILKYQTSNLVWAFSLGWRTDPRAYGNGYEDNHVDEMLDLIKKHSKVTENVGIVLALNARQLMRGFGPIRRFMENVNGSQMLVWTGTGEPSISQSKINLIKNRLVFAGRVGFDCKVSSSELFGLVSETLIFLSGLYWNAFVKR